MNPNPDSLKGTHPKSQASDSVAESLSSDGVGCFIMTGSSNNFLTNISKPYLDWFLLLKALFMPSGSSLPHVVSGSLNKLRLPDTVLLYSLTI